MNEAALCPWSGVVCDQLAAPCNAVRLIGHFSQARAQPLGRLCYRVLQGEEQSGERFAERSQSELSQGLWL